MRLWIFLASQLCTSVTFCQGMQTNSITGQITNLSEAKSQKIIDEVRFYEPDGNTRIPYGRIKGSPFWKDEFLPARIYTTTGQLYSSPIRLNLVTNEIYFLKNGEEMVLVELSIDKIAFSLDNDSALFLANIASLLLNNKKENGYVQVLNAGNCQLLKYTKRTVDSADSLFRTQKRYFFTDEVSYFLSSNDKIEKIKRLNKDNVMRLLPLSLSYNSWIDQNKTDFRKEEDVIRFLNYYNIMQAGKAN